MSKNSGKFLLLDPSFRGAHGGSMTFGAGVAEAAKQQNIRMQMVVNKAIPDGDTGLYNAEPLFTVAEELSKTRYKPAGTDIEAFFETYKRDLDRLAQLMNPEDVAWDYYLLGPMQVLAYLRWLESLEENRRPKVLAGVDVYTEHWFNWLSPAASRLKEMEPWLRITSASITNMRRISSQLGIKVQLMPRIVLSRAQQSLPLDEGMLRLVGTPSPKKGALVGFFTDPTPTKSFHLLGDVVDALMDQTNLRFVMTVRHEPTDDRSAASLALLRRLSEAAPDRVMLIDGSLPYQAYKTIVELCDGVLIAYDPASHFADTPAGTMCEVFAAETVPIVVEGTSMAKELDFFGFEIPKIAAQNCESFVEVLKDFSTEYQHWWHKNAAQINEWNKFQSHKNLFELVKKAAWSDAKPFRTTLP